MGKEELVCPVRFFFDGKINSAGSIEIRFHLTGVIPFRFRKIRLKAPDIDGLKIINGKVHSLAILKHDIDSDNFLVDH